MNLLSDIITYVRRIIKSVSDSEITDTLIIDYINRFWIMDVDARMQLFDLKTKFQFQTTPAVDKYNMPLYAFQSETPGNPTAQDISYYPVYQGFISPAFINGIQVPIQSQQETFFNIWPNIVQNMPVVSVGNGTAGPYTIQFPILSGVNVPPNPPTQGALRGHIDISGVIAYANQFGVYQDPPLVTSTQITNNDPFIQTVPTPSIDYQIFITTQDATAQNVVVTDSGQFLASNTNYGLLIERGNAPYGNLPLTGGPAPNYSTIQNTVNYLSGVISNLYFPKSIPQGQNINAQCFFFQAGLPRGILYYNNTVYLRSPPDNQYLVELTAYLTPAAFFSQSQSVQFAYMSEYIARGAARKILSDTGDWEQYDRYEPLFKEQELLVWKRSQRQFTNSRTGRIYSEGINQGQSGFNNLGGSTL
jgi:hypothetical protein